MDIKIVSERGHYTVYINETFFCSADTYSEAVKELKSVGVI